MRDQRSGLGQIIQIMCAAAFLSMTAAAQTYITTGQTGAQTQIDVNHTSTWTFTPASNTTLSGGYFTMKDGSATTADVTLSLYAGPTATGAPLATITLDHTTFCTGFSLCSQWAFHTFAFGSAPTLTGGSSYTATLTSNAVDSQNQAYFIKNGGTVTLTGSAPPAISAPSLTKSFSSATTPLNSPKTLTLTIGNANTSGLTGISVSDTLPSGMSFASPNGLATTCGGTPTASGGVLSLTGGSLAAGATCTLQVNIVVTSAGVKTNTTLAVSSNESGAGDVASASITGVAAPGLTKTFSVSATYASSNSPFTMTLTLSNSNAISLTGVGVSDTLPSGMSLSSPSNLQSTCGGSASASGGVVSVSGVTLAASSSCTVRVSVYLTTSGSVTNITGAPTSTEGGSGSTAQATVSGTIGTPTLSGWGMLFLAGVLVLVGGRQIRGIQEV